MEEQGVDVDHHRLEEVEGEHGDLLAVGAGSSESLPSTM